MSRVTAGADVNDVFLGDRPENLIRNSVNHEFDVVASEAKQSPVLGIPGYHHHEIASAEKRRLATT